MRKYTDEQAKFIAENVEGRTCRELSDLVNAKFGPGFVTESIIKSYKTNHKLKSGTPCGKPAGQPTDQYPAAVKAYIEKHYKGTGHKAMVDALNSTFGTAYSVSQIKSYYHNHRLDSGLKGHFHAGHIPFNKGKKGQGGWKPTQFKKGSIPANYRPVGSERVNVEGYVEIKVADPNKWRLKQRVIWEQHNGPIPKGHVVLFVMEIKATLTLITLFWCQIAN